VQAWGTRKIIVFLQSKGTYTKQKHKENGKEIELIVGVCVCVCVFVNVRAVRSVLSWPKILSCV
jgi:hypothetical protein